MCTYMYNVHVAVTTSLFATKCIQTLWDSFHIDSILLGGDIIVKLGRSDYFEADTRASEDPSLEKIEANYKGGEFEMQFACRFKGSNKPKEREIFGKVFVKRRKEDGSEERLFEFNLIKVHCAFKKM